MKKLICVLVLLFNSSVTFAGICERNTFVVAELETQLGKKCDLIQSADLNQLKSLRLDDQKVGALTASDFKDLSQLQALSLSNCGITDFSSSDLFSEMPNLEFLNLDQNKIQALDPVLLLPLTHLKTLSLNANALTNLPEDLFSNLKELKTLSLDANKLNALPEGVFTHLISLEALSLNNNSLNDFPAALIANNQALKVLLLVRNQLISFSSKALVGFNSFKILLLDGNPIAEVKDLSFTELPGLKYVGLRNTLLSDSGKRNLSLNNPTITFDFNN